MKSAEDPLYSKYMKLKRDRGADVVGPILPSSEKSADISSSIHHISESGASPSDDKPIRLVTHRFSKIKMFMCIAFFVCLILFVLLDNDR